MKKALAVSLGKTVFLLILGGIILVLGMLLFAKQDEAAMMSVKDFREYAGAAGLAAIDAEAEREVAARRASGDLFPDLAPLPPLDLTVERREEDGAPLLRFSTTYFNEGDGPLELRADEKTAGVREDIERDVFQRVYDKEGAYRDVLVGNFLWHQEHLHYHFTDFIEYDLEPVEAPEREDLEGTRVKSTFCIRDVSRVDLELPNRSLEGEYLICGKEIQGVSVGWGDTYFFDYPDQVISVEGLEAGTYRLTFNVNPAQRIEELRYDNNIASVLVYLDPKAGTVEILEVSPESAPEFEHVYLEQPFGETPQ